IMALKYLIDPHSPFTSGALRTVDLVLPGDTIVNPSPPHSCMFYWEPVLAVMNATFQAVNPALGGHAIAPDSWGGTIHYANGSLPDGTPWFSNAGGTTTPMGPWGATEVGDGDSSQVMILLNMFDSGCEPAEHDNPLVILRNDHLPDTAGAGKHRSGAASVTDSLWLAGGEHRVSTFHIRRPPGGGGVNGGRSGTLAGGWLWDADRTDAVREPRFLPLSVRDELYAESQPLMGVLDPATKELDPDGEYHFLLDPTPAAAGSILRFICNGAGGWGDPLERNPNKVLEDVRDEYVTVEGAARDYGVVVLGDPQHDPEGLAVDEAATAELRATGVRA
ncbi:MAG TPA: hydantoinase B/oxoprolinase family protein, partial [Mycobacteriales bacterium]|nr:hydantoinase B/oxoprolinase family protein [Mycobacteriales bacterium]